MGLFSTKKIVSVSANTFHLVDSGTEPVKDAVLTAIMTGQALPETILKSLFAGLGTKMPRAYNYARDHYTLGLPSGEASTIGNLTNSEINPFIKTEEGYAHNVNTIGYVYDTLTPSIAVYPFLLTTRGYNSSTTEITTWPAGLTWDPVFGLDVTTMERRVTIKSVALNGDGVNADILYDLEVNRPVTIRGTDEYPGDRIEMHWHTQATPYTETVAIPDVGSLTWDEPCVVAHYQKYNLAGDTLLPEIFAWVYRISTGLYPTLDPTINTPIQDEFLPVVPVRYNNVDYTDIARVDEPLYITSKALLKKLKFDFKHLGDLINQNPDVGSIDHAYIMFGVDLQTEHNESLYYLNTFFNQLYAVQQRDEFAFLASLGEPYVLTQPQNTQRLVSRYRGRVTGPPPGNTTTFAENGLDLSIDYDYITSTTGPGTIGNGKIGATTKSSEAITKSVFVGYSSNSENGVVPLYESVTKNTLQLDTQISPGTIRTVTVFGLEVRNKIYGDHSEYTSMRDVIMNEDEHNLVLPLQFNIAQSFTLPQRNALYAESTLMVANSYDIQKVKWYASGFFMFLLIVVAVVITIWSGGATSWINTLIAEMGKGVVATLMYVLPVILTSIVIDVAMDWIISEFGAQLGIIGAVLMTVAAVVLTQGRGTDKAIEFMMKTSQHLLQTAQALISSANEFLVEEGQAIVDEYAAFSDKLEDRYEELKGITEILNPEWKADLDPLTFTRPSRFKNIPGETPDAFYTRCLGLAGNTMYVIHNEIPQFIGARLTLDRNIPIDLYSTNTRTA